MFVKKRLIILLSLLSAFILLLFAGTQSSAFRSYWAVSRATSTPLPSNTFEPTEETPPAATATPLPGTPSPQNPGTEEPPVTPSPSAQATPKPTALPPSSTSTPSAPPAKETSSPAPTPQASPAPKGQSWYYQRNNTHKPSGIPSSASKLLEKYDGYYVYNTEQKVFYLTFDEGYENGYTPSILDTLLNHGVKASFFATKSFITKNPDLVRRMVDEGHLVLNHTVTHPSLYLLSDEKIKEELSGVEKAYTEVTGLEMHKCVRPPKGDYSEASLKATQALGYKTIFWSIALPNDWNLSKQPTKEETVSLFKNYHHNGAIALLHAVSSSVTENLDEMLQILEEEGYEFRLISDI